jgi:hypothetical protein
VLGLEFQENLLNGRSDTAQKYFVLQVMCPSLGADLDQTDKGA